MNERNKNSVGFSLLLSLLFCGFTAFAQQKPAMYYTDTTSGLPIAKDPNIIKFRGNYLMYYSIPGKEMQGWHIGIARSSDLVHWNKTGDIFPEADYEKRGLCAPGALIKDGKVHLFYQTYGNGAKDAICHAVSTDGIHFTRDATNPVFHPHGNWTNGRAIDAEVIEFKGRYFLYFATRDPQGTIQKQGVAVAPSGSDFSKNSWKQAADSSILKPELVWEGNCVEGASILKKGNTLFMFYAGNYNNAPQQIGVAKSRDGIHWQRLSDKPFLPNGKPGEWNSSESGHPDIFRDENGKTYLFYQGNNTNGRSWYLSQREIVWKNDKPVLKN